MHATLLNEARNKSETLMFFFLLGPQGVCVLGFGSTYND
jgi:hypothetical protein